MTVLALLCGVLTACSIYLLLGREIWRRLAGLALLGNGLALLLVAAGEGKASAVRIAIALMWGAFALFLAYASFVRLSRRSRESAEPGAGGQS